VETGQKRFSQLLQNGKRVQIQATTLQDVGRCQYYFCFISAESRVQSYRQALWLLDGRNEAEREGYGHLAAASFQIASKRCYSYNRIGDCPSSAYHIHHALSLSLLV
jgi:hypothetical protein